MEGIQPIIQRNAGCCYHRITQPLKYLGVDVDSTPKQSTDELLKNTKILIFNRSPENSFENVTKFQKKYGFKIIVDLDDFWQLNVTHPMYSTWVKLKSTETILQWVRHADAVIVTTKRLADKASIYNDNVHVIPNALPFGKEQFTADRDESEFMRFIYAGQSSHLFDIKILTNPFSRLGQMPNAQFVLAGWQDTQIWKRMENSFTVNGKLKNYDRIPNKTLPEYMDVYKSSDVCLVPLESNIFTPFKSNIKFLEAGCKNVPVICSMTPPYSDEPMENNTGAIMFASNIREWVHWIKYCYNNPSYVKEKGLELGEYVRKNYELTNVNEYRKQLFENLMS